LREISAALAEAGHLNERGVEYSSNAIKHMIEA
jgi:hypothetical protein